MSSKFLLYHPRRPEVDFPVVDPSETPPTNVPRRRTGFCETIIIRADVPKSSFPQVLALPGFGMR